MNTDHRRLHREITQARVRLNRAKPVQLEGAPEATPPPMPVRDALPDDLPAIKPVNPNSFRVLRAKYPAGKQEQWGWECIYETRSRIEAVQIAAASRFKAIAQAPDGKQVFQNFAPMKEVA